LYIVGNLCLSPNVNLSQSKVGVGGNLDISNNASVGANTSNEHARRDPGRRQLPLRKQQPAVGHHAPGTRDANHIYSKLADGTTIGSTTHLT
jgi:hypothetical protein